MARCPTCHRRLRSGQSCPQHAGPVAPAEHRDIGATPQWARPLGACIGSGGFAAVWEISDGGGGGRAVLKVAHADHDLARSRMRREAEALAAIGAPAVPRHEGSGVLADGRAWIAMERIDGKSVTDVIGDGPRIAHAISIADAILAALERVHAAGFVHRDLKPDNLVVRPDGTVVILDLGLARKLPVDPDDPTRAGVQVGSLEYMPPEQLLDAASTGTRADLYAFGCVLYELCSGRPPFIGDGAALERAHAALRPPPLGALATVPSAVEAFVHDCLAKLPDRRPPSATELRQRLAAMRDETPSLQRAQHSVSVIREGKQPVVLLWAELPRVDRALLGMLAARKISIVSQRGRRVFGGIAGADHADPAGAAIAAARDLAAAGARVVLHLDALHVVPRASGTTFAGAAIDKPETWVPVAPWTGVVVTRALAAVIQTPTRPAELGAGFVMLGDTTQITQLFGRDALLADLAADAAAALAGAGPGMTLLVGDHGVGKTAVARALRGQLRDLGADLHVAEIPPPGSGRPGHSALASLFSTPEGGTTEGGTPEGPIVRAVGDAIRTAARSRPTAIIVDNLQLAEHDLLDALEYATLGGEPLALWILGLATPRLEHRRPGFGARAERHHVLRLPPLAEDDAVAMTAALLRPAEYPPLRALRQIVAIARGNPMHLATLVREIHERGAIRTRPNGEHFLDTTALDALPPIALGPWLAARELAHVSVELVALARVCAVLGDEIDCDELAAVVEAVERRGGATTTIDVDVGLRELTTAGILATPAPCAWTFPHALLQDGIYATTDEAERTVLHQAALEYWRHKDMANVQVADRIARHAEAVGDHATAAAAFATLGDDAQREHRVLDADQAWQGALRNLDPGNVERGRALVGRARARYRLQRVNEAVLDLEETVAIAQQAADPMLEIEALLEQATAFDWTQDFDRSTAAAARARALFERDRDRYARFAIAIEFAAARAAFRDGQLASAEVLLRAVLGGAQASHDDSAEVDAGLLLGCVLVDRGLLDEAHDVLDRMIALCERTGDRFHLGAAYNNRTILWSARGDIERVASDLRIAIQLARELGQSSIERAATYNLAEDRLWQGHLDEALLLGRRSLALQTGHGEGTTRLDELLLARIFAALDHRPDLAASLASLAGYELEPDEAVICQVLRAVLQRDAAEVDRAIAHVVDRAQPIATPTRLELMHVASKHGLLATERRAVARELGAGDPIWSRRLDDF
ncbi:MAG: protein kinase [Myxococcota bacterium]|nr:protein kinase [Myxococcota bacterium]